MSHFTSQSKVIALYGNEQAEFISVHGDGYKQQLHPSKPQKQSLLDKESVLNLSPVGAFIISIDCSCIRAEASTLSARLKLKSGNHEGKLADFFSKPKTSRGGTEDAEEDEDDYYDDDDDDEYLYLDNLLKTLRRFTSRQLNPFQAKHLARLARSYRGKELMKIHHVQQLLEFLDSESPPIEDAVLIALTRLCTREENLYFIFYQASEILDVILSLASDAPTLEVQVSALRAIEQITQHSKFVQEWDSQLEDIVYPLLRTTIKNPKSTDQQKLASLAVLRNLSKLESFAPRVKQDILSQLLSPSDSSKVKGAQLEVLCDNLQGSKQRVSSDILDNALLPVLTGMLEQGPCESQKQALKLLACIAEDEYSRACLLTSTDTVPFALLCVKHTKCRKVRALSAKVIGQLLNAKITSEANQLMECNVESVQLESYKHDVSHLKVKTDRASSALRRKSQAETKMWRHFDDLIDQLITLLETEGCIYSDSTLSKVTSELSLIGSINKDQLLCISALIGCFNSLCLWPLHRPRTPKSSIGDVNDSLTSNILKMVLSAINRHHTIDIWTRVGPQVMAIFRQVIKRLPLSGEKNSSVMPDSNRSPTQVQTSAQKQPGLESILYKEEAELLNSLLDFIFLMSIASCSFKKGELSEGQAAGAKASSESMEKRMKAELAEKEAGAERRMLRRSLVDEGIMYLLSRLLCLEDDHIQAMSTMILRLCLQPLSEKTQDSTNRRACFVTRNLEKMRPQSAMARLTSHFRRSVDQRLFHMSKPGSETRPQSSIPYCTRKSSIPSGTGGGIVVRDSHGRARPVSARPASAKSYSYSSFVTPSTVRPRPGSAKFNSFSPLTPRSTRKPIFTRGGELAPESSQGKTLGYKVATKLSESQEVDEKQEEEAGSLSRRDVLDSERSASRSETKSVTFNPGGSQARVHCWSQKDCDSLLLSPLDSGTSINKQCCERALVASGEVTLKGIFSASADVKRSCVLFLHDLVLNSDNEVHMELSKMGCIPKLLDFLRINEDDELLEITGLTIARVLVTSDRRICQLFQRYGGSNLLMALLKKQPSDTLRQELCSTLNTVNNVMHPGAKGNVTQQPSDIWEHIMQRWEGEDEVKAVLQQFL